jgi:hypothetical protein
MADDENQYPRRCPHGRAVNTTRDPDGFLRDRAAECKHCEQNSWVSAGYVRQGEPIPSYTREPLPNAADYARGANVPTGTSAPPLVLPPPAPPTPAG